LVRLPLLTSISVFAAHSSRLRREVRISFTFSTPLIAFRLFILATAAAPPCALHTQSLYLVIASMPHEVPSRLVALQRTLFVRPLVNWFFSMASRQPMLPAVTGCGLAMTNQVIADGSATVAGLQGFIVTCARQNFAS
jgi:hypothetical protein